MARKSVKRYALRYTVIAGLPSGIALLGIATLFSVPPLLAALVMALSTITLAALLAGVTEAGIETASSGAEAGFMSGSDATKYQPADLPIPDRLAIVCWLLGLGIVGIAGLVVFN